MALTKWALYGLSSVLAVLIGLRGMLGSMGSTLSAGLVGGLLPLPRVL